MNRLRRCLRTVVLGACVTAFAAGARGEFPANYDEQGEPTNIPKLVQARPLAAWGLTGAFIVGTLAIGFWSSKRTHLD